MLAWTQRLTEGGRALQTMQSIGHAKNVCDKAPTTPEAPALRGVDFQIRAIEVCLICMCLFNLFPKLCIARVTYVGWR
jgi:hypothetical protein